MMSNFDYLKFFYNYNENNNLLINIKMNGNIIEPIIISSIISSVIIVTIFSIIFYLKITKNKNIDKIYCINLKKNKDRWQKLKKHKNIMRINAVNCSKKVPEKYIKYIEEDALKRLIDANKNKYRSKHGDITNGAVGCYLSHIKTWKKSRENKYTLILEDDVILDDNFEEEIKKIINNAPIFWDIIVFGYFNLYKTKQKEYTRLKKFLNTHCYVINKNAINVLLKDVYPIKKQLDWYISDKSNELNIYGVKKYYQDKRFKTDIQIPVK